MSRIRGKDTRPELLVRRVAHRLGYRFRLHREDLPGTPDLVFPRYRKVIFVHGCFWHRHDNCPKAAPSKTRVEYWKAKQDRNTARDQESSAKLLELGWSSLVIWECQTRDEAKVERTIIDFLGGA